MLLIKLWKIIYNKKTLNYFKEKKIFMLNQLVIEILFLNQVQIIQIKIIVIKNYFLEIV